MVHRIIYLSSSATDLGERDVDNILAASRELNGAAGLTGLLVYHDGNFIQVLEGRREAVEDCYSRIERDRRHRNVTCVFAEDVADRVFGEWSMAAMPFEDASSAARDGFLELQALGTSDAMRSAQRDVVIDTFLNAFLGSLRGLAGRA